GREDSGTIYSSDPVAVAVRWSQEGAERLHIVNLDGAFGRASKATDILRSVSSLTGITVQFGGGLRSREAIRGAFEAGASSVVLGTVAFENTELLAETLAEYGPGRVIVAIDALNGVVATRGWKELTGRDVHAAAGDLRRSGVLEILCTEISRDGMMSGPDLGTLAGLAKSGLSVIASGGISSLEDVRALLAPQFEHITGAIIGKALYEGKIGLRSAIAVARGGSDDGISPGGETAHPTPPNPGKT
ncbi:MAG TPA: 1-(5-phosphoribosyl)-5-[(5-phosphoribosylamino)methylideneamino] imidazole-4-carboxamide isomerase, partial [Bacteroidota bacterium]|nr:1-(5-phosphoribosyl)-5-[(5-phosphoribosylamino)methylideneamino] imidazole-4-carboxamide isomerase [Bacteroidota bacterium]